MLRIDRIMSQDNCSSIRISTMRSTRLNEEEFVPTAKGHSPLLWERIL
jgi:hypothetical protein